MNKKLSALLIGLVAAASPQKTKSADIAYILEDASSINPRVVNSFSNVGLTYDLVRDSEIPSTDFSRYSALVLPENIDNRELIPFGQENTLFFDRWLANEAWPETNTGIIGNQKPVRVLDSEHWVFEGINVEVNQEIDVYTAPSVMQYLVMEPDYIDPAASLTADYRPVIASSVRDLGYGDTRDVFFGLQDAENWNGASQQMFENSLRYVVPEPSALYLIAAGTASAGAIRRKR